MKKKLIFDKKTGEFRFDSPALIDFNNWVSGFKKFILSEFSGGNYIEVSTNLFSKKPSNQVIPNIRFYEVSRIQIYLLESITSGKLKVDYLFTSNRDMVPEFIKYVKSIKNSTIDKLKTLKVNQKPAGWEELKHIKYLTRNCNSIESHGCHRIIYDINLPYRLNVTSILFHYGNSPTSFFDRILWDIYTDLIEDTPKDSELMSSLLDFLKKVNK